MQPKQFLICLLTAYLVLLLNFGDSLHRLTCFGLHDHGTVNAEPSHHVGCHCHLPPLSDNSEQSDSLKSNHDCAFCKFFDQYHGTTDWSLTEASALSVETLEWMGPQAAFSNCFNPTARGPPVSNA